MGKGEDASDDARETRHGGQDHESPGGIPVGCTGTNTAGGQRAQQEDIVRAGKELSHNSEPDLHTNKHHLSHDDDRT